MRVDYPGSNPEIPDDQLPETRPYEHCFYCGDVSNGLFCCYWCHLRPYPVEDAAVTAERFGLDLQEVQMRYTSGFRKRKVYGIGYQRCSECRHPCAYASLCAVCAHKKRVKSKEDLVNQ